ncbi:MAG TPA: sigma-70 family RNA polymerase sigma factor [Acidimicrobiales bacterium]|nr:sigma-70 family RNA polymerase sigma factor [Acidimicrobiales bacterium]
MVVETPVVAVGEPAAHSARHDAPSGSDRWGEFWATRSPAARNELTLVYLPVVRAAVGRLPAEMRVHWDPEDLESFGLLGLLDAIDRFEAGSDPRLFPAYAHKRVRGAVYDELRRLDWLPRSVRRRVVAYRRALDLLSGELGRTPSTAEVFAAMGVGANRGSEIMRDVQSAQLASIQQGDSAGDQPFSDHLMSDRDREPEQTVVASSEIEEMRLAVASLPERQRVVINLRFLGGLTQSQVATVLGLSTSRISQIESGALAELRRLLCEEWLQRLEEAV